AGSASGGCANSVSSGRRSPLEENASWSKKPKACADQRWSSCRRAAADSIGPSSTIAPLLVRASAPCSVNCHWPAGVAAPLHSGKVAKRLSIATSGRCSATNSKLCSAAAIGDHSRRSATRRRPVFQYAEHPQERIPAMKSICASLSLCLLAACAGMREPPVPPTAFRLTSPGNPDNAMMQPKNAGNFAKNPNCTGQNVSPPLAWSNAPDKTRSFAIIWDDQAGRAGLGVSHAVIYGIPANVTSFAEGALGDAPTGAFVPGKNTLGLHWLGPCPPKGNAPQHYVMTIIATSLEPNELQPGLTRAELLKALEGGKALRAASLTFRFWQ